MKNNKVAVYYGLLVVLFILIGISSFFFNYFYNLRNEDLSIENLAVTESNKMSYTVKTFDNEFFKTSAEETNYMLSLVDNINSYFNISSTFSSPVTGEYSYFVKGYIIMHQGGESVKNEISSGEINKFKIDGSVINLTGGFDIDLDKIVRDYQEQIRKMGADVTAEINYEVTYNYNVFSETLSKSLNKSKTLNVRIPIRDITNIRLTEDKDETRNEFSELNQDDNKVYVVVCLEFLGAIIIFILLIVLIVKRINGNVSIYEEKLNDILSKYSKELVYLKELPDLSNYDVLFVQDFEDILETSRKLKTPINYIEIIDKHESTFLVIKNTQVYVYKLNSKNA